MSFASDQDARSGHGPSPLGQRMTELREDVFAEWERRVRASVKGARELSHPVLINTFPALYDNLVQALTPGYPRTSAAVATPSVAVEHGGERARLSAYEANAVICEYQLLRSTILDLLKLHQVPVSDEEIRIITSAIDASIREAVTAFELAQSKLREQFVAALAHDLRNPLSAASAAAQVIPHLTDLGKIATLAGKIQLNIERIDQMIQDLLDTVVFQQGERLHIQPTQFDMLALAREVCEQMAATNGPRFEVRGAEVEGWWGREQIKRALENLLGNAIKYGAPDTLVVVSVKEYHERVLLSVHNEGDAIPAGQVEHMFQVFRRAKAAKDSDKKGWGIGLPFARSVAESHGGSIDVDSSDDRGTTFSIDIPIDARPFQNAPTLG
ncbi:MAG TPA: HAMP domain-containing sensor histidine kinase [Noviherbaspirillum sp.]|jgi:signal transduction histidine kinase|uniref:sensor histidine kinase n=1 Tax=Noviherbaspirillum sp. TaxID=1926288 RepID=UPI002F92A0E7